MFNIAFAASWSGYTSSHLLPPATPPAVLDQVIIVPLICSPIPDDQDTVIEALTARGDDPTAVEHHSLRGTDADLQQQHTTIVMQVR